MKTTRRDKRHAKPIGPKGTYVTELDCLTEGELIAWKLFLYGTAAIVFIGSWFLMKFVWKVLAGE